LTDLSESGRQPGGTVLENALARLKAEVEAIEISITMLETIDHSKTLQVVLKALKARTGVL
jgi:hypothetical protein